MDVKTVMAIIVILLLGMSFGDAKADEDVVAELDRLQQEVKTRCRGHVRGSWGCQQQFKRIKALKEALKQQTWTGFEFRCPTGFAYMSCTHTARCIPAEAIASCNDKGEVVLDFESTWLIVWKRLEALREEYRNADPSRKP